MPDARLNPAIEAAAALSGNAGLVGVFRSRPLPSGVADVLRMLAVGQSQAIDPHLRVTLENYVQQVLLHPGASPHRILGVEAGASRDQMRANMRSLMLWLHPDAAGEDWRSAFAPRVLEAWRAVSASEGAPPIAGAPPAWPAQTGSSRAPLKRRGRAPVRGRPRLNRSVGRTSSWRRLRVGLVAVVALVVLAGVVLLTLERPHAYAPHSSLWGRLVSW